VAYSSQTYITFKLAYLKNYIAYCNQILHNNKDLQLLFVGGPNQAQNKSKTTDGWHFENLKNVHDSATVQATAPKFGTMMLGPSVKPMSTRKSVFLKIQNRRQPLFSF